MTVRAVETYNYDKSAFPTVLAGTAIGAGAGYLARNILPVTKTETNFNPRVIELSSFKVANRNMVNEIKAAAAKAQGIDKVTKSTKLNLSPAQDAFVKVVEKKRGGEAFSNSGIAKTVKSLEKISLQAAEEYQNIIKTVNKTARTNAERLVKACKAMIKNERRVAGFVVPGAVLGLLAGAFVNAFRDNKQA